MSPETPSITPPAPAAQTPDELVESHLGLIDQALRYFRHRTPPWGDEGLVRSGAYLGLRRAAARFQPRQGVPFAGYAWIAVTGAVRDVFRREAPEKYRRGMSSLRSRVDKATEELTFRLQRVPTEREIEVQLGWAPGRYRQVSARLLAAASAFSLDDNRSLAGDGNQTLYDILDPKRALIDEVDEIEEGDRRAMRQLALQCAGELPPKHQRALMAVAGEGNLTSVGVELGLTRSRMSQIASEALFQVRRKFHTQYKRLASQEDSGIPRRLRELPGASGWKDQKGIHRMRKLSASDVRKAA